MAEDIWVTDGDQFTCSSLTDAKYVGKKPWGPAYGDLKVYCPALMKNISMDIATIEIRGNDHDFQSVNITTNKDPSVYHP